MKPLFLFIALTAFTLCNAQTIDNTLATVTEQQGIYIFMLSKPTQKYDYMGTVKIKLKWTGEPDEMLRKMLNKLKQDYPKANGIIFTNLNMESADVVMFRN